MNYLTIIRRRGNEYVRVVYRDEVEYLTIIPLTLVVHELIANDTHTSFCSREVSYSAVTMP
jgi:hypothetical protein